MRRPFLARSAAVLAVLLLSTLAAANEKDAPARLSAADLHMLSVLHSTNLMEIEMGKMANTKATRPAIKRYGQTLAADHQKADREVLALARARGATLPEHATPVDDAEQEQMNQDMATMNHVKSLTGSAFDQAFLAMMVDGHARALAKVDAGATATTDAKVKALLLKIKPALQKHHDRAKELATPAAASR